MNSVLMIFIDGVGIGKEDYQYNPFFKYGFKTFTSLFGRIPSLKNQVLKKDGKYLFPSDALLGVAGLPQSGTGQTSIFCGINAARFVGKHFGPYPYSTLIPLIRQHNIFFYLRRQDKKVSFANAYPKVFFDYLKSGKSRLSVTSLSCLLSGVRLNKVTDVRKGKALTAEITNERWNQKLGYDLPVIKPETAARRLLRISAENKFTLYEYFLTDYIGHNRYDGEIREVIDKLDRFLFTIIQELDSKTTSLLVCSDHGNFEDLSTRSHTFNPALTISAGRYAEKLYKQIRNITQIKSAVVNILK